MKKIILIAATLFTPIAVQAQYQQVGLTVFGMDCAPCAHAIHVSMKAIPGVNSVDVDLNTGLVLIKLTPANAASMRQFNQAVERNGFTHKDAEILVQGHLTGSPSAPILEVTGTPDRFALTPATNPTDLTALIGHTVILQGTLPLAPKGQLATTVRYKSIKEAQ